MKKALVGILLAVVVAVYFLNASWLAPQQTGGPTLYSHRGVYQTYSKKDLGKLDCTATRIFPPTHGYLENTIASVEQSLALGADVIEVDIKPTVDGEIVVFHDHTLDCRTDGTGVTHKQTLAYLKSLDIGFGYTHDGGKTFPFRGQGVGMMPTLAELYTAFPDAQFLLNIKNSNPKFPAYLVRYLGEKSILPDAKIMAYGRKQAQLQEIKDLLPESIVFSKESVKDCIYRYMALGWSGYIPQSCDNTLLLIPTNYTAFIWGWPNRFIDRMTAVNTTVVLMNKDSDAGTFTGFHTPDQLAVLPAGYGGGIWVEGIENIGPAIKKKR
ncbi:glycerophosphodiester phosphodiesterase [Exilibacterium tricleocarpae]|uniref:Glycerophosphodiester phosphodiesterase n=1 Tax=Exilibacterium tricleocarpae TaxID=2591008 RepID=A0A545SQU8_9GAMM|nr:glycerophosphodiester phosphodiesterase family protein [Exilibacterium tricleocarpae]TQV67337.1 glycerophosphodiester phosphodiesterase [Exilibacterium tricleocarpae]